MAHLLPAGGVQTKLAALSAADATARHQAHTDVTVELAKVAGVLMAQGSLTPEMLKEAGLGGKLVRWGAKKMGLLKKAPLKPKVEAGSLSSRVGRPVGTPAASAAPAAAPSTASVGPKIRRKGKIVGEAAPKGRVTPAGAAPAQAAPKAAKKGKVKEAPKEAPAAAPAEAAKKKPFLGGMSGVGRMAWRARAPIGLAALGGGIYGTGKAVGWAARQAEQASATPMAYGGGWSPTPYGYGHSPYGPGNPTMGHGS